MRARARPFEIHFSTPASLAGGGPAGGCRRTPPAASRSSASPAGASRTRGARRAGTLRATPLCVRKAAAANEIKI